MIRNIWAVGRNYQAHAAELGNKVPSKPMIFLKAGSSAAVNSNELLLPWWTTEVHHEIELALHFGANLQITEGSLALDLTERQWQNEAKKNGEPWTLAKSFRESCQISPGFRIRDLSEVRDRYLKLWINEELKQEGRTSQMIFSMEKLVDYLLTYFPVCPGDYLLTGTPAGVGPLKDGDKLKAQFENELTHVWTVKKEAKPRDPAQQ